MMHYRDPPMGLGLKVIALTCLTIFIMQVGLLISYVGGMHGHPASVVDEQSWTAITRDVLYCSGFGSTVFLTMVGFILYTGDRKIEVAFLIASVHITYLAGLLAIIRLRQATYIHLFSSLLIDTCLLIGSVGVVGSVALFTIERDISDKRKHSLMVSARWLLLFGSILNSIAIKLYFVNLEYSDAVIVASVSITCELASVVLFACGRPDPIDPT